MIFAFLSLALACNRGGDEPGTDVSQQKSMKIAVPLLIEGEAGTWTPTGETQTFAGEGLFDHINGGADIFYEYGFDALAVQQYNNEEKAVSVEVYRMSDPAAAFGIYTYNRHPSLTFAEVGNGGSIHPSGLFFWQDRYYIDIRQLGTAAISSDEFLGLAKAVLVKKEPTGGQPAVMALLPPENMIPQSEVFARGRIAINNQIYLAEEDLFGLREGEDAAIARYRTVPETTVIIAAYSNEDASESAYDRISTRFAGTGRTTEDILVVEQMPEKHLCAGKVGKYLVVVAGADNRDNAVAAFVSIAENLKEQ